MAENEQLQLLIRDRQRSVSLDIVRAQATFKDALKLCKSISGLNDQQICHELGVDPAQWSRIWGGSAHFPDNLIQRYMQVCQNIVPIIWLALSHGYALQPLKSELETENEQLRAALEAKGRELQVITDFMRQVKA